MLSLFPYALSFTLFAPLLFRIALAATLGYAAKGHVQMPDIRMRVLAVVEFITAGFLIVGLWTQAAALAAIVIAGVWFFFPTRTYALSTVLLAGAIAASLFVTGAGRFAFDLPF